MDVNISSNPAITLNTAGAMYYSIAKRGGKILWLQQHLNHTLPLKLMKNQNSSLFKGVHLL